MPIVDLTSAAGLAFGFGLGRSPCFEVPALVVGDFTLELGRLFVVLG